MKPRSLFLPLLLLLLLAGSCKEESSSRQTEVVLLHTNDMHAEIEPFARLASYVAQQQAAHEHVFLLSAGDIFSGNPVVDFYEEKGQPIIALMNRSGYAVSTLGNHEFDYGQEVLARRMEEAAFPFIAANVQIAATNPVLPQIAPYHVLEAGPVELLLLGLLETSNGGLPATHPDRLEGLEFTDPLEAAADYIPLAEEYDAFIGLTHLGYRSDRRLAERYNAFDLIIGGHSHTVMERPEMVNNALITQAGDDLNFVGRVVLTFEGEELVSKTASLVDLRNWQEADDELQALITEYNNNESLNRVIGEAAAPIRGKAELGALFTDALTEMHALDFAFQNDGGIRIGEIPAGDIRVRQIYEMDPFGNEVIRFDMSVAEIKSLLRHSYERGNDVDLRIGGGTYTLHVDQQGALQEIVLQDKEGNVLTNDQTFRVGMNSFIAASYDFEHTDPGTSLFITTAETIINYIEQQPALEYSGIRRIFIAQ